MQSIDVRATTRAGPEVAAAVAREHLVAAAHLLDRPVRAVAHRDACSRDETLIGVADDHHVAVLFGEHAHELPLGDVRVLELVDEHVVEAVPPAREHVGVLAEQPHREHEQVVEVDGRRLERGGAGTRV